MPVIEHYENLTFSLSREDLERAILSYLALPTSWHLDDLDVTHEGSAFTVSAFLTRPLTTPTTEVLT